MFQEFAFVCVVYIAEVVTNIYHCLSHADFGAACVVYTISQKLVQPKIMKFIWEKLD